MGSVSARWALVSGALGRCRETLLGLGGPSAEKKYTAGTICFHAAGRGLTTLRKCSVILMVKTGGENAVDPAEAGRRRAVFLALARTLWPEQAYR